MYRNAVLAVCCLAAILSCGAAARADFEAGQTAWDAGRTAEALAQWGAAAETGDARAMLALGRAHVKGLGVPQDYVEAHKWLNLAAGLGSVEAAAERDALAEDMTAGERAEARKLARAWRSRGAPTASRPSTGDAPAAESPAGPPPRAVREAQALLAALGYRPGPPDGHWGPQTGRAYAAFLRDTGMPPGDMLTPGALRAMRTAAGGRNVTEAPAERRPAPPPVDLHRLVNAGDVDGLKAALATGADVNVRDARGWTPLMLAVDKGYTLLVPHLLEAGADPDIRLADGATALFMAAVHGHDEIIDLLMKGGADASIKGPGGKTVASLFPPGKEFHDCPECPEMVVVPAGSFTMGSPASEKGRDRDEGPQRRVTIAESFAVGKYEVTRGEFGKFVEATGHAMRNSCWDNPGFRQTDRDPVVCVNWKDAQAYVRWLSEKTGQRYRLLTEAEWEYAARAGTWSRYHWGDSIGQGRANCHDCGSRWGNKQTAPVGSFSANGFGLHDMHGNVWEWVEDCWHGDYAGAPSDGSAWTSGGDCSRRGRRVLRGGSWFNSPGYLRSAIRIKNGAGDRDDDIGFRVARTLAP